MAGTRASIFGEVEPDFDVSDFAPASRQSKPEAPPREAVAAVSDAAGFHRRDPAPPIASPNRRVWRTGRNVQFNVKATPETVERFKAISDDHGWPLAVTLEHAISALERELNHSPEEGGYVSPDPVPHAKPE